MKTQTLLETIDDIRHLFYQEDGRLCLHTEYSLETVQDETDEYQIRLVKAIWDISHDVGGDSQYFKEYADELIYAIKEHLEYINEDEIESLERDFEDMMYEICEPDISNYDRYQWLAAHRDHQRYVEEAIDDFGWEGIGESLDQAFGVGQQRYKERIAYGLFNLIEEFRKE